MEIFKSIGYTQAHAFIYIIGFHRSVVFISFLLIAHYLDNYILVSRQTPNVRIFVR